MLLQSRTGVRHGTYVVRATKSLHPNTTSFNFREIIFVSTMATNEDYDEDPSSFDDATPLESLTAQDVPKIFQDVTPIPQLDTPVCRIEYKPDFVLAFDYFRAIVASGEVSFRAFRLTQLCLELNPANYTVWQVRRRLLRILLGQASTTPTTGAAPSSVSFAYELRLAATLGGSNPKNYQIWYHRRAILESALSDSSSSSSSSSVEALPPNDATTVMPLSSSPGVAVAMLRQELLYLDSVIAADGKNYHAWSHRQWVVGTLAAAATTARSTSAPNNDDDVINSVWGEERNCTSRWIQTDVRNNSAWNHRWFTMHRGQADRPLEPLASDEEAEYALQQATLDPHNESPWRYLVAIVKERIKTLSSETDRILTLERYEAKATAVQPDISNTDEDAAVPLWAAITDLAELRGDSGRVKELTDRLVELDPIRQKYWRWRGQQAQGGGAPPAAADPR